MNYRKGTCKRTVVKSQQPFVTLRPNGNLVDKIRMEIAAPAGNAALFSLESL